jgi:D-alanine-D-alanine ligase
VSLRSAANVVRALRGLGHRVSVADPSDPGFNLKAHARGHQLVLPILHGEGGEDGQIQLQLEEHGLPYLGSASSASALAFDKLSHKQWMVSQGIPTPSWQVVTRATLPETISGRNSFVLRPIRGGSSIDTHVVHDHVSQPLPDERLDELFGRYTEMLLEELIAGHELTVAVVGDRALPVVLIIPPDGEEFDYDNKYNGRTREVPNPEHIDPAIQQAAQRLALRVHRGMGCRHLSRTDIMVDSSGGLHVLEINTLPGMTEGSLLPKAALAGGMTMSQLAARLVELVAPGTEFGIGMKEL